MFPIKLYIQISLSTKGDFPKKGSFILEPKLPHRKNKLAILVILFKVVITLRTAKERPTRKGVRLYPQMDTNYLSKS